MNLLRISGKSCHFLMLFFLVLFSSLNIQPILTISAYWTPILPQVCGAQVSKNITQQLFACDKLMDSQLTTIFDDCVRSVNFLKADTKLTKPKLCYYLKMGMQLDRCKMARYQSQGITLPELVDREQDHTWCLMKIAQPLGWERLCSDNVADVAFLMAKQQAIQTCEQNFSEITNPIRDCYRVEVLQSQHQHSSPLAAAKLKSGSNIFQQNMNNNNNRDKYRPAACLSFQYSRKIWKCLVEKDSNQQQNMQRRANMYISCLRTIRQQQQQSSQTLIA